MINYKLHKLQNGLRVITAPLKNTKAATILVGVNVGSRFETDEIGGISHFLEHMVFKGTEKRPNTLTISSELDAFGAEFNAFTGEDTTWFFISSAGEYLERATDILSDMLLHSKFDQKEISQEQKVIIEELRMYLDDSRRRILELAKTDLWPDNQAGKDIIGTEKSIQNIDAEKIKNYQKQFYSLKNLIVVVAGEIKNESKILEQIKKDFAVLETGQDNIPEIIQTKQTKPQTKIHYKKTDQAHCVLSFRGFSRLDKRRPILKVLSNLLGGMMSSRLFIEVREKAGLGYYIRSQIWDFQDAGALAIHFGVDKDRVDEAIKIILRECKDLKNKSVSGEELKRSKDNLEGGMYLGLEGSMDIAEFLLEQELFWQKIEQPEVVVGEVQKVTADDIQKLARGIFQSKNLNFAVIGPYKDEEKFKKILTEFH